MNWATRVSAAQDEADRTAALEQQITGYGWTVRRHYRHATPVVILERPAGIPGLYETIGFDAATMFEAMQAAATWVLAQEVGE